MPFSGYGDLDPQFAAALQQLVTAVPGLTPYSGYRDIPHQTRLWNAAVKKYGSEEAADDWVARPGTSQHNKRLAVDLSYANDAARKAAHERAGEFGLAFPMEHEPWHIELAKAVVADPSIPPDYKAAMLGAIREMESTNRYDVRYDSRGGTTFDTSKGWAHPNVRAPIFDKAGQVQNYSTAAGGYQFIGSTWDRLAKQYNLADFSPANQDIGAWKLAAEQYGGEEQLLAALAGDPTAVAGKLGGQWEALAKSPEKFAELYKAKLGQAGTAAPAPGSSSPYALPVASKAADPREKFAELASKAVAGFGGTTKPFSADVPATPAAANVQAEARPMFDPQQQADRRQQLALIMQRLNQGTLV